MGLFKTIEVAEVARPAVQLAGGLLQRAAEKVRRSCVDPARWLIAGEQGKHM